MFVAPSLLAAAREAAAHQDYPKGTLYLVATPIGNQADITLRALHLLDLADTVACEDTRHTAALLQGYGLHKPLLAVHEHNEAEAATGVLQRLQAGERVAYVSDAGTPGVSDPGARLVAAVAAAGCRTVPLPGASSVTALLSVAGGAGHDPRWVFAGFLPTRAAERQRALQALAHEPRGCVLLEAPHRIEALARDLKALGHRPLTVGRELTKRFEDIGRCTCDGLFEWLHAAPHRLRGEFALYLHPMPLSTDEGMDPETLKMLDRLLQELPLKTAVRLCADLSGASRNALYKHALARQPHGGGEQETPDA